MRIPGSYEEETELRALAEELRARRVNFAKDLALKRKRTHKRPTWNRPETPPITHESRTSDAVDDPLEKNKTFNGPTHLDGASRVGSGSDTAVLSQRYVGPYNSLR